MIKSKKIILIISSEESFKENFLLILASIYIKDARKIDGEKDVIKRYTIKKLKIIKSR